MSNKDSRENPSNRLADSVELASLALFAVVADTEGGSSGTSGCPSSSDGSLSVIFCFRYRESF